MLEKPRGNLYQIEHQFFAAWLRDHGVVFFALEGDRKEAIDVRFVQLQWASSNDAQTMRMLFEDPRELRNSVMLGSTWWTHVEKIVLVEAPVTTIRRDQLGWWTEQSWMVEKL